MDDVVKSFLEPGPIAVVGATDSPHKFGREICRVLKDRGHTVYAVNNHAETVGGERAYASVKDLPPDVEAAVVAVRPDQALPVVDDAVARGLKRLWFQRGADFSEAASRAQAAGIATVTGRCILMYASPVTGVHKFHQTLARFFGKY